MRISRKLMISNVLLSLATIIILSFIISKGTNRYIREDLKDDLIAENKIVIEALKYKKFITVENEKMYVDLSYYNKVLKNPTSTIIVDLKEGQNTIETYPKDLSSKTSDEDIKKLIEKDIMSIQEVKLIDESYLFYSNKAYLNIEGQNYELLVITLLKNELAAKITNQIVIALISAIVLVTTVSMLITAYNDKMITKPIEVLITGTEEIAKKNFDKKVDLKTKDEFEELANAINKMTKSLKSQDLEQKKFYENVSHEIKTPISVISGYAEGIKENIFEDEEKALETIVEECRKLKIQLDNIIYLSKLDTVNDFYHYEEYNINQLIIEAIEKLEVIIIINEIDIIFEPKEEIMIKVDKEKMVRLFINIISNCLKYTKDEIEIKVSKNNKGVEIEISDNGNGFNDKVLENPFGRAMVGDKEGSGIGLSIIKKIIDGHRGRIEIENKKDGGAIYRIEI